MRKRLDRAERSTGIGGGAGSVILDGEGPPDCLIGSPATTTSTPRPAAVRPQDG